MHIPVLKKEVIEYLNPESNENFIDCTINEGGHSLAILEKTGPRGIVLGIDWDEKVVENFKNSKQIENFKERIILVCDNFANLEKIVEKYKLNHVNGILLDLGFSTWHIKESNKGFSFQKDEALDMRYSLENSVDARKIVNSYSLEDIEKILKEYGEEKFAKNIAKEIIKERKKKKIETTFQLVDIIKIAVPQRYQRGKIHFATRTFQALRIAVNEELNNIEKVLLQALNVLNIGGRLAVISFHSLEDRIVKNFFREQYKENKNIDILTKKPIVASLEEIKINNLSRSAKLRAIIKIK